MIREVIKNTESANKHKVAPVTELWKRIFSHKLSRTSPYPGTQIERFPVPDDKISWKHKFEGYVPVQYDNPGLGLFSEPRDPYKVHYFNEIQDGINRRSYVAEYFIVDGRPLNPKGRTGLAGRGELERWGPNHTTLSLLSRWAVKEHKVYSIEKQRILEVLAVRRSGNTMWELPGGYIGEKETLSGAHKRNLIECAMALRTKSTTEKLRIEQRTDRWMQSGIILYKGYFDDTRNTDNAWIEAHCINYHQEDEDFPSQFVASGNVEEIKWLTLDSVQDMTRINQWILKKMCIHLAAYNPYKGDTLMHNETRALACKKDETVLI